MRNITYKPTKLQDSIICEFEGTKALLECGGSLTTSQPDEVKRSFFWTALEIQVVELFYKVLVHPETWKHTFAHCSLLLNNLDIKNCMVLESLPSSFLFLGACNCKQRQIGVLDVDCSR